MTRPSPRALLAGALALVLVAAVVVGVVRWRGGDEDAAPGDAPTDLAQDAALAFFSLDHRTLEEDRDRLFALTTDSFEESYAEQSGALAEQVEAKEMVLTPTVPEDGTALELLTEDEASVLVAVDVRTEAAGGASADERYRTRIHLVRDAAEDGGDGGDDWEVDRIEQVTATDAGQADETGRAGDGLSGGTREAVRSAAAGTTLALSYDYRDLDAGLDGAVATMTEEFGEEFRRTFAGSAAALAEQKEAVTAATVAGSGLVRSDDADHALCLVFVDQALVSSATLGEPDEPAQVSQNRVLVEMVRVDDRWLVDSIQPF